MTGFISLGLISTPASPINFTALTSPNGATYTDYQGEDGSDWYTVREGFDVAQKREGGGQCTPSYITGGDPGGGGFQEWFVVWESADEATQAAPRGASFLVVGKDIAGINNGLKWTLRADRSTARFVALGDLYGGTWVIKATLSDGSYPVQTLPIVNANGFNNFRCDFRAAHRDATLNLELRRTVDSGSAGYMRYGAFYKTIPTPEVFPRLIRTMR